jgi:hypothetical protein
VDLWTSPTVCFGVRRNAETSIPRDSGSSAAGQDQEPSTPEMIATHSVAATARRSARAWAAAVVVGSGGTGGTGNSNRAICWLWSTRPFAASFRSKTVPASEPCRVHVHHHAAHGGGKRR